MREREVAKRKDACVWVRLEKKAKEKLESVAKKNKWDLSTTVRHMIEDELEKIDTEG